MSREIKNCELLFEYLQSILNDSEPKELDHKNLDEEYLKLGQKLRYLQHCVEELLDYTENLAAGKLSVDFPSQDNFLCTNLKTLHENLRHLSVHIKQIGAGDYVQHASYMGDITEELNSTTRQLAWREMLLKRDAEAERKVSMHLHNKAYHDAATGIFNRRYFEELMQKIFQEKHLVTFCFIDMDGLKYVNDYYGHMEGDLYIRMFVETILSSFRTSDIFCRVGGDEFVLLMQDCTPVIAEKKLADARRMFMTAYEKPYPMGFSYGIVEVNGKADKELVTVDAVVEKADAAMYQFKRKYKQKAPKNAPPHDGKA